MLKYSTMVDIIDKVSLQQGFIGNPATGIVKWDPHMHWSQT